MRALFFVFIVVVLVSCTARNDVPSGIISPQKMETILWQLMQSDEYVNIQLLKDSLKKGSIEKMRIYQQVFDLNGTSLAEFKKSYGYYMSHPDITRILFDSISAKGTRQRAELYNITKPDSSKVKPAVLPLDTLSRIKAGIGLRSPQLPVNFLKKKSRLRRKKPAIPSNTLHP